MTKDEKNAKRRAYYATLNGKAKIQAQQKIYRGSSTGKLSSRIYQAEHLEQAREANVRARQKKWDAIQAVKATNRAAKEAAKAAGQIGFDCIMAGGSIKRLPC